MIKHWAPLTEDIKALMRTMRGDAPNVMKAFSGLAQAASAPQAIDIKTKELIALAISVAIRCDDCIGFHVKAALDHGATRAEIVETLGMAIYMGAGPSVMYATHALEAYEQFAKPATATTAA
jgi:AhpD family alkylhydroperoxidase